MYVARKSKPIQLSKSDRSELENSYKLSDHHCFRQRCKMILLKSEGYTSKKISNILNTNGISVHNWVKRYEREGIEGLRTKPGQGCKRILEEDHIDIVRAAVEQERQRLSQAQKIIEQNIGKKMSNETLTCFLEVITAVTSE